MLDSNDPLIALADTINWDLFNDSFAKYYSNEGRPAKPIRLMVGLLLLKQIEKIFAMSVGLRDLYTLYESHKPKTKRQREDLCTA